MGFDEFDKAISSGAPDMVLAFFKGKSENERKPFADRALQWLQVNIYGTSQGLTTLESLALGDLGSARSFEVLQEKQKAAKELAKVIPVAARTRENRAAIQAAILASCSLTEIKKLRFIALSDAQSTLAVMVERKPRWLSNFADWLCERHEGGYFGVVRALEREHGVVVEHNADYLSCLAIGLPLQSEDLAAVLSEDSQLLSICQNDMLQSFQSVRATVDVAFRSQLMSNSGFHSMLARTIARESTAHNGHPAVMFVNKMTEFWQTAFVELLKREKLERQSFLDALLQALVSCAQSESELSPNATTNGSPCQWLIAIHDAVQPSLAEKEARLPMYSRLLNCGVPVVLAWDVNVCTELLEGNCIAPDELVPQLEPLFFVKRKEPALQVLKLLKTMATKEKSRHSLVARFAAIALEHPSQEVQKRAAALVTAYGDTQNEELVQDLLSRLQHAGALQKQSVSKWLANAGAALTEAAQPDAAASELPAEQIVLARSLPAQLAQLSGVSACLAVLDGAAESLPALTLDPRHVPRIGPATLIQPIESLDDLMMTLLRLLENEGSADELEQALDGISRLCDQRPADFAVRLSPLRKRAEFLLSNDAVSEFAGARPAPFVGQSLRSDLAALVLAWLSERHEKLLRPGVTTFAATFMFLAAAPGPLCFSSLRFYNLAERVSKRVALPLLSAPTHKEGFIDARALPERIKIWQQAGKIPDATDQIQCLLRIAIENRSQALIAAKELQQTEFVLALRYALQDDVDVPKSSPALVAAALRLFGNGSLGAPLWSAAARARDPLADDPKLEASFSGLGPDSARVARFAPNIDVANTAQGNYSYLYKRDSQVPFERFLEVSPGRRRDESLLFPCELLSSKPSQFLWGMADRSLHERYMWPLSKESHLAAEARQANAHVESQSIGWRGDWEALFDADVAGNGMAGWLVILALSSKNADTAAIAADALIALIDDCRMDGEGFGKVLKDAVRFERIKLGRLVTAFKQASRTSPLHVHVLQEALELSLQGLPCPDESPPVKLLELLFELKHESGASVRDAKARTYLSSIAERAQSKKAQSKSGKLATSLLALQGGTAPLAQAAAYALDRCLKRAQRWQKLMAISDVVLAGEDQPVSAT